MVKIKIFKEVFIQSVLVFIYTEASLEKSRETINLRLLGATAVVDLLLAVPVMDVLLLLVLLVIFAREDSCVSLSHVELTLAAVALATSSA